MRDFQQTLSNRLPPGLQGPQSRGTTGAYTLSLSPIVLGSLTGYALGSLVSPSILSKGIGLTSGLTAGVGLSHYLGKRQQRMQNEKYDNYMLSHYGNDFYDLPLDAAKHRVDERDAVLKKTSAAQLLTACDLAFDVARW